MALNQVVAEISARSADNDAAVYLSGAEDLVLESQLMVVFPSLSLRRLRVSIESLSFFPEERECR